MPDRRAFPIVRLQTYMKEADGGERYKQDKMPETTRNMDNQISRMNDKLMELRKRLRRSVCMLC